jgi:hypothetical protein
MTSSLNVPHVAIVESTDPIASCNVCGTQNYVRVADTGCAGTGLRLWDLRTSPNGFQTYVTKLCGHCARVIRDQLEDVVLRAENAV